VDITPLQHATNIRLIRSAAFQPLERGGLISKSFEKGVGKLCRIERLLGEAGYGFFDFYGVHGVLERDDRSKFVREF
jgi:hypothetical protein